MCNVKETNDATLRKWQKFFGEFYLYYMLGIVARYYCMQFKGTLMNQTGENGKKLYNHG